MSSPSLPEWLAEPNPEIYLGDNYVVLDLETYGGRYGDAGTAEAGIVVACWLDGLSYHQQEGGHGGVVSHAVGGEFDLAALVERIQSADFVVCHNAKFELKWLHRMGGNLRRTLPYCTQLGEYVLQGNRRVPLGLDAVAIRHGVGRKGKFVGALIKGGVDTRDIPRKWLIDYCAQDVRLTHDIFLRQRQLLRESGLLQVQLGRCAVTPALAEIEFEGMQLDAERVAGTADSIFKEYAGASERLSGITGGINFRSGKQLGEYIYGKLGFDQPRDWRGSPIQTAGGKAKTDKATLEQLKARTPEQKEFLGALRAITPLKKKVQILETLLKCCEKDEGRVYAEFNQSVTQTHRLSSTGGKYGLQFHNFPREFKPLFRPRDAGWVMCEADAPQLEFRVAADICGDDRARQDIREGVDIHEFTASVMGVSRQRAKAHTFKPLYGGNSGAPRERRYYKAFRERYKGIFETQSGWTYSVLEHKALRTPSGLIFYWPDTDLTRSGYVKNTPSIFNYPIQMFATADIMPLTLALVWHKARGLRVRLVNTVHDSIIAEVHPDDLEEYKKVLVDCFTKDIYHVLAKLYHYTFTTPLGVGIKVATHWGEGEEIKYEGDCSGYQH